MGDRHAENAPGAARTQPVFSGARRLADADTESILPWVGDELLVREALLHLAPEAGNLAGEPTGGDPKSGDVVLDHIMKRDHAAGTHEGRVSLEVLPDRLVGVIAIQEEEVDALWQKSASLLGRLRGGRVSDYELDVLLASSKGSEKVRTLRVLDVDRDQACIRAGDLREEIERSSPGRADLEYPPRAPTFQKVEERDNLSRLLPRCEWAPARDSLEVLWPTA